jgi:hypothetical protein
MPGWGIVADLMPPEVLQQRRVKVVKRYVITGLSMLIVLLVLAYGYAFWQNQSAANALSKEQDRTSALQAQVHQYAGVTTIQGTVAGVQGQVANLMKGDVDVPALLGHVQAALPPGVTISQLAMTLNSGNAVSPAGSAQAGAAALDPGTNAHIGALTISGTAHRLTDVSAFVDKLKTIAGVVEPYPASNTSSPAGVQYAVQLTLDDQLFTHRFDIPKTGAN